MSRPGYSEAAHRKAVERFARYVRSDCAMTALRRWGKWSGTSKGRHVMLQLYLLADQLLCGDVTSQQYAKAQLELGASTQVPPEDFEVLARYALELDRCCFFGHGHVPIVDVDPLAPEGVV